MGTRNYLGILLVLTCCFSAIAQENAQTLRVDLKYLYMNTWQIESVFKDLMNEVQLPECYKSERLIPTKTDEGNMFSYLPPTGCNIHEPDFFEVISELTDENEMIYFIELFKLNDRNEKMITDRLEVRETTSRRMILLKVDGKGTTLAYYYQKVD